MGTKKWFLLINDEQRGPYERSVIESGIAEGKIKPGDLAWQDGMEDWLPIVAALKLEVAEGGNAPPPPAPWERKASEGISHQQGFPPAPKTEKPHWYYSTWLIVLLLFFITPLGLILLWLQKPRHKFLGKTITRVIISLLFGGVWLFGIITWLADGTPWVECEYAEDGGAVCSVGRDGGLGTKRVCWKIVEQCVNGIKTHVRACQDVSSDSVAKKYIPPEKFINGDKCDDVTSSAIEYVVFGKEKNSSTTEDSQRNVGSADSPAPAAEPSNVTDNAMARQPVVQELPAKGEEPQKTADQAKAVQEPPPPEVPAVENDTKPSLSEQPYVVVAASVKQSLSDGRERAEKKAEELRTAGFGAAGVYDGREFPNFKCCFWVVIAGSFDGADQAAELRDKVTAAGFEAYVKNAYK